MSRPDTAVAIIAHRPEAAAIRAAAALALRGADESARRSGAVPVDVRRLAPSTCRLRGHALRRFAAWVEGNPQPDMSASADAYAEYLFAAGKSVATVASDLCARVSEVAALRNRDVTAAEDGSATVEVWAAKTGTARTGYLRASTVHRVRAWTAAAGIGNGSPLFPSMDRWGRPKGRAMSPRAVADAIRLRAAAVKLDASGHSLRVGAAVIMASRGASLVAMQAAGGWTSPTMPAHYGRQASARRGAVATLRPEDKRA